MEKICSFDPAIHNIDMYEYNKSEYESKPAHSNFAMKYTGDARRDEEVRNKPQ